MRRVPFSGMRMGNEQRQIIIWKIKILKKKKKKNLSEILLFTKKEKVLNYMAKQFSI